ncbi:uncharacterized protein SPAPADRAFT_59912 [Spathaspora passalidarum NRRL Y-27907]|uniref:Myb-like domain-containing protein n=1 Tax=Spathaspora passalidarum (strain NRRL Y-27907 / 11-Y1) TaxID=619300 RepID=G3AIR4_SPAPN|nr:uncharacterized protein SPAPADRAFT_59912 [Spathaspora passalidarum NRRL Y-27907]EGW34480.1 hypothetical protein SPAPADRAFT_59912 [Spathaspora passalidarum NRRL Y-27907]
MTMADLCKPTLPIGKVSGNFQLVKEAKATLREKRDLRRKDRELAKIRRVPVEEAKKMNIKARKEEAEKRGETIEDVAESDSKKELEKKSLFDEDAPKVSSNLQLQLTDGKIVFDEESAIIVKPRADIAGRSIEHSNPFATPITSTTYSKRVVTDKWEASEVITFYQALSMFGTDFSLIAQLFPYRTRKQVKSKFTLEERKHPEVVSVALKRKLPVDFEKYCQNINTKIETLDYYNEELKKVRHEHEQSLNAIAVERDRALREDAEASRRREIEIRTGAKPMTRAEKLKELRKNEMVVGSIDDVKKQREGEEVSK